MYEIEKYKYLIKLFLVCVIEIAECLIYMLSNTQQLYLCQHVKVYEVGSLLPRIFLGPLNFHCLNLYFIYNLLPLTTMQNIMCSIFRSILTWDGQFWYGHHIMSHIF